MSLYSFFLLSTDISFCTSLLIRILYSLWFSFLCFPAQFSLSLSPSLSLSHIFDLSLPFSPLTFPFSINFLFDTNLNDSIFHKLLFPSFFLYPFFSLYHLLFWHQLLNVHPSHESSLSLSRSLSLSFSLSLSHVFLSLSCFSQSISLSSLI